MSTSSLSLVALEDAGHISSDELNSGLAAEASGTPGHTIGYELEVLRSAGLDIPKAQGFSDDIQESCRNEVSLYEFGVTEDGLYEIQSPYAQHPLSLAIATRGLIRTGWLPENTSGTITGHASIGTEVSGTAVRREELRLIHSLRIVELLGASSPGRLMSPLDGATNNDAKKRWNCKGTAGVMAASLADGKSWWVGTNTRVEFRTLQYRNLEQWGTTLDTLYLLSRAQLTEPGNAAANIYNDFYNWTQEYFESHRLPLFHYFIDLENVDEFRNYLKPYALHLKDGNRSALIERASSALLHLREEFNLT